MNDNGSATTTDTTITDTTAAEQALSVWLEMWNTDSTIAQRICSDDFRIHFANSEPDGSNLGDLVRGADAFAAFLDSWRQRHAGVVFTARSRAIDADHGRMLWDVAVGGQRAGGVDVFDFTPGGRIREVWSVGGTRGW